MIKINGPTLADLDMDLASLLFFSAKSRRCKVPTRFRKGAQITYKWGETWGHDDAKEGPAVAVMTPEIAEDIKVFDAIRCLPALPWRVYTS